MPIVVDTTSEASNLDNVQPTDPDIAVFLDKEIDNKGENLMPNSNSGSNTTSR